MDPKELGEKSSYSYDEMMSQLRRSRSGGSGSGKRRRRRSEQPKKRRSVTTKLMIGIVVAFVFLLLVIAAVITIAKFRYGGDSFRRQVSERVSELTGLDVEFSKFSVNGLTLSVRDARATKSESTLVQEVSAVALKGTASADSFFSDAWSLPQLQAYETSIVLGIPALAEGGDVGVETPKPATLGGSGGLGLSSTPTSIAVDSFRSVETNIVWGDLTETASGIHGLGFYANFFGGNMKFRGNGGRFLWSGLEWEIARLEGEAEGSVISVEKARLAAGRVDSLQLAGQIDLRPGGAAEVSGLMGDYDMSFFLPDSWSNRLIGAIDAEFIYRFTFAEGETPELEGTFTMPKLGVTNLPVFDALAIYVAAPEFNFVEFNNVEGKFSVGGDGTVISGLDIHRPGLVRLSGDVRISKDGGLGGDLEIGLPEPMFAAIGGVPSLFELRADGFAWARLGLGGTLNQPTDQLADTIRAEIQNRVRSRSEVPGNPLRSQVPREASGSTPAPAPVEPLDVPGLREEKLEDMFQELIR